MDQNPNKMAKEQKLPPLRHAWDPFKDGKVRPMTPADRYEALLTAIEIKMAKINSGFMKCEQREILAQWLARQNDADLLLLFGKGIARPVDLTANVTVKPFEEVAKELMAAAGEMK